LPVPGSPAKKITRRPARRGSAARAADRCPPRHESLVPRSCAAGGSAAVAQPDEQLARRKRDAKTLLEEPVDEREADEAQADAERPALARDSQIQNGRDQGGPRKAEEPDRRV